MGEIGRAVMFLRIRDSLIRIDDILFASTERVVENRKGKKGKSDAPPDHDWTLHIETQHTRWNFYAKTREEATAMLSHVEACLERFGEMVEED